MNKYNAQLYEYLIYKVFDAYIEQAKDLKDDMRTKYEPYAWYARHLIDNLDTIYIKILETWLPFKGLKELDCWNELAKKREMLIHYQKHCFEYRGRPGVYRFLSLAEQNEKAKKYVHYDFSAKKPKSFGEVRNER